jgi:hypothetical protein
MSDNQQQAKHPVVDEMRTKMEEAGVAFAYRSRLLTDLNDAFIMIKIAIEETKR